MNISLLRHSFSTRLSALLAVLAASLGSPACAQAEPEVRGTWVTTTANRHIATPADTAESMRRLREIGLNAVYVETWKNGYTQFPSRTLESVIGLDRRPDLMPQDPSETDPPPARDLLGETVIEAHRNGLLYIGWFEYGFMAAHESTQNHLREMYPQWLSRDQDGGVVAPNGFVWMNPLHPRTRRFLMDIVLEAVDTYDLDGVQLDDRIVWPYVTMGYDEYTVAAYRNEHGGVAPPEDPRDPGWMRWRAEKINRFSRQFVAELRAKRPGLIVSLSPAPYPWCYENYLLEWPTWAGWRPGNREQALFDERGRVQQGGPGVWWDEFIPQCYRYDYAAFETTWDEQVRNLRDEGGVAAGRVDDLIAGILTTGSRPDPVPWDDLRRAVEHVRTSGGGGHVWWFSRGVLDEYPDEITALYDVEANGHAKHPDRPADWRPAPIVCAITGGGGATDEWTPIEPVPDGHYRVIARPDLARLGTGQSEPRLGAWKVVQLVEARNGRFVGDDGGLVDQSIWLPYRYAGVELLVDRRPDMQRAMP